MVYKFVTLAVLSTLCTSVFAEEKTISLNEVESLRQQGNSIRTFTPVFSQLVTFSFPKGFVPAYEAAQGSQYIQEAVLEGESVKKWSQMITLTGGKSLASNPNINPARFASAMASGFKRVCPDSYATSDLGDIKIGSYDGHVSVASCGIVNPTDALYSESMLMIVIKGEKDYYTIQWAERGESSMTPIKFDSDKWNDRLKRLSPIKLCPIVPGEQLPYPSCTKQS
ncbi:hypothetical protein [Leeia oryzae]|uniref:hypothetical protein n=1 Tax=Leeia oryzae TaxID=356662 RepID=UPI0012E9DA89|nr:hypothetical protein [Leeia oryzae]